MRPILIVAQALLLDKAASSDTGSRGNVVPNEAIEFATNSVGRLEEVTWCTPDGHLKRKICETNSHLTPSPLGDDNPLGIISPSDYDEPKDFINEIKNTVINHLKDVTDIEQQKEIFTSLTGCTNFHHLSSTVDDDMFSKLKEMCQHDVITTTAGPTGTNDGKDSGAEGPDREDTGGADRVEDIGGAEQAEAPSDEEENLNYLIVLLSLSCLTLSLLVVIVCIRSPRASAPPAPVAPPAGAGAGGVAPAVFGAADGAAGAPGTAPPAAVVGAAEEEKKLEEKLEKLQKKLEGFQK